MDGRIEPILRIDRISEREDALLQSESAVGFHPNALSVIADVVAARVFTACTSSIFQSARFSATSEGRRW